MKSLAPEAPIQVPLIEGSGSGAGVSAGAATLLGLVGSAGGLLATVCGIGVVNGAHAFNAHASIIPISSLRIEQAPSGF
jgi:hypothetical protein